MKHRYSFARCCRLGAALFFLLLLNAPGAWAQLAKIYYTQGSSTAALDAARAVNPDGTGGATLASAAASFAQPTDIVFDKAGGYLYVADQFVSTGGILRFSTAGTGRTVVVPNTAGATYNGLALDVANNRLFFTQGSATDPSLDALKVVNLSTLAVTTLATGAANFAQPTDLALDATNGLLYVADQFTSTGAVLRFTTAGAGRTVVVPPTANANYNGLALDAAGNRLFFTQGSASPALDALKVVSLSTGFAVTALASGAANFTQPTDVAYDALGQQVYVADQFVGTGGILRYSTTGTGRTVVVPATAGATYNGLALDVNAAPVVTTATPTSITSTSATLGGNVTADGGASVTGRGVVYSSTATTPAIGGTGVTQDTNGSGTGTFSETIAGLTAATTYYVRAYAINSAGTSYGAVQAFTTQTTVTSIVRASANPTNAGTVSFTLTFANPVTGLSLSNFGLTAIGLSTLPSISSVSGSGTTYTVVVNTGTGSGTLLLSLVSSTGLSPGVSNVPFTSGETYTIDKTAPTVAISSTAGASGSTTSTSPIPFTITFSEAVTGFVAGDVTVGNGTLSGFAGSGTTYTFNVTPAGNGAVTVSVPANVAQDAASNANTAAPSFSITYSQPVTAAPVVTAPANGSLVNTATPTYAGTAVAASTVTVFVDGTSIGTTTATAGGTFSLAQPTALAQGSHTVRATAQASGEAVSGNSNTNTFTVDSVPPTVAITSTTAASGGGSSSATFAYTVTFSEAVTGFVAGDVSVTNGAISGFTAVSGTTYTFNVTPAGNGVVNVTVPAAVAQDAAGNANTAGTPAPYAITYSAPTATVVSVTRLTLSPTATAQVSYRVVFSASVSGVTVSNFSVTPTGSVSGAAVSSVSGSGTTYTAVVNTGTGNGTLRLDVANATGISPSVTNTPYTAGELYTITKSFAAAPQLTIVGTSGTGSDVTAFVDQVQVLSGGSPFANALLNGSFETHDPLGNGDFGYNPTGASWAFNSRSGIAESGSAFTPITPIPNGIAVAFVQSFGGVNGQLQQNLAVPTGSSYQVSFQTAQRVCCTTLDQALNVFLNGVFVGNIQPPSTSSYSTFTSATFSVTAPALTATVSTTSGSPTSTAPIPFSVSFSQSVGTTFTASDVTVTGGTITGGSFSGSGSGPYTFTMTPTGSGIVTVGLATNVANDVNNTLNSASNTVSVQYSQPVTATPVVTAPGNGSLLNTTTPTYTGTAPAGSTVMVIVDGTAIGTTTATAGGSFSLTQPTALSQGSHTVYATAQTSGSAVSANSNTNTFTVDSVRPSVAISSSAGANGSTTGTTPIPFTVTFSENVTGFVAGDVTVTNGSIGTVSGSGTTYTFNVTPATPGTATTVSVPANVAQDAAGNFNTAGTPAPFSITFVPTSVTWNGSISTDWFTAGNWTPNAVPTTAIDASIPASAPNMPAIAASTASAKVLTINSGATVSQSGGTLDVRANLTNNGTFQPTGGTVVLGSTALASLLGSSNTRFWNLTVGANGAQSSTSASTSVQRLFTLNGNFATNGNPLTLESNATNTALVVNNGSSAISGNVTVQRYISPATNPGLGYRHYSAPVSTATVAGLATAGFTPVVNPNYNTSATPTAETPFPTVYGYDQARLTTTSNNLSEFDKGWFSPNSLSEALTVGKGYTVNLSAGQTMSVTGPQNNGTLAQTLASNRATTTEGGYHLVGNPYSAPLDYNQVAAADRVGLEGAMYVYQSTGQYVGQYGFFINGIGNISPVLAQGQGFFVRVAAGQTSGQLTLRNSHRVTSYVNPSFQRGSNTRPLVQLDLQGAGQTDPLYVYFENGATAGVDAEFDAVKLPNSTGLNLAAWAGTDKLAINGLPVMGTASVTVPLFIGLPATGTYTLHAAQLLNFALGTQPFLRDLQFNTLTDLSLTPNYTFTMNAANNTPRFELVFGPAKVLGTASAALAAQVAVFPNPARTAVFVELPGSLARKAVTLALVDALGRVVLTKVLPAGLATHTLPLLNVAIGVYALRLQTEAGMVVKKLVVE